MNDMNETATTSPSLNGAKPPPAAATKKASAKKPAAKKAAAKPTAKKASAKKAPKGKSKTAVKATRAPRGQHLDKKVSITCDGNPCREGTKQHEYFSKLKNGQTVAAAVERGFPAMMAPVYAKRGWIKLS